MSDKKPIFFDKSGKSRKKYIEIYGSEKMVSLIPIVCFIALVSTGIMVCTSSWVKFVFAVIGFLGYLFLGVFVFVKNIKYLNKKHKIQKN